MRRTIHLVPRGSETPRCAICDEVVLTGQPYRRGAPAICANSGDWNAIYLNHPEYRRCVDNPDHRDRPALAAFPPPEEPGYYWAEWRIAEDDTWPDGEENVITFLPEVVHVVPSFDPDDPLEVEVPGCSVNQSLENFIWRSARLEPPKGG